MVAAWACAAAAAAMDRGREKGVNTLLALKDVSNPSETVRVSDQFDKWKKLIEKQLILKIIFRWRGRRHSQLALIETE